MRCWLRGQILCSVVMLWYPELGMPLNHGILHLEHRSSIKIRRHRRTRISDALLYTSVHNFVVLSYFLCPRSSCFSLSFRPKLTSQADFWQLNPRQIWQTCTMVQCLHGPPDQPSVTKWMPKTVRGVLLLQLRITSFLQVQMPSSNLREIR